MKNFIKEHLPYVAAILLLTFCFLPVTTVSMILSIRLYNALSPTNYIQKK